MALVNAIDLYIFFLGCESRKRIFVFIFRLFVRFLAMQVHQYHLRAYVRHKFEFYDSSCWDGHWLQYWSTMRMACGFEASDTSILVLEYSYGTSFGVTTPIIVDCAKNWIKMLHKCVSILAILKFYLASLYVYKYRVWNRWLFVWCSRCIEMYEIVQKFTNFWHAKTKCYSLFFCKLKIL